MRPGRLRCSLRRSSDGNANARPARVRCQHRRIAPMADLNVVEVRIWDQLVGAVAPLKGKPGFYEFQYAPAFENDGLELSPLTMQLKSKPRFSFPGLPRETFHGLPGLLADSLPDKFGNSLIDEYLSRHGTRIADITTLQRLVYVGPRADGPIR